YNADGLVGDQEIAYQARKARGGIALSITGSTTVHPSGGAPQMNLLANFDDTVLPGYRKLAEAMHAHGARMLIQVTHLASGFSSHHTGHATWAPSQMMGEFARELPHVMNTQEIEEIVQVIDRSGMIDFYTVASGNNMERFARVDHWPPTPAPQALHRGLAAGIKEMVQRPVAALARIVDPFLAEELIASGTCDLVAMVRANIADPDLPNKLAEGRPEDVRPCVGDSTACIDRILEGEPLRCIYNPSIGREQEWGDLPRAAVSK